MHITTGHPEIAAYYDDIIETIAVPDIIYEGSKGGLIAVSREIEGTNKHIVVAYKEISENDGFIITAYISNKLNSIRKRVIIWKP